MTNKELYWLVGILEGEGSFLKGPPCSPNLPIVTVNMTDEDVIAKVAIMFGGLKYQKVKKRKAHWKQSYSVRLVGKNARMLMMKLQPLMSFRRQEQIEIALRSYDPKITERRWKHMEKLTIDNVLSAKIRIDLGESLRSVARSMKVHHESLRRRMITVCGT